MSTTHASASDELSEAYLDLYAQVHGQHPSLQYTGNHWYIVNGETIHGSMIERELEHMREQLRRQAQRSRRSMIQRLIGKLRGV